jgi:hypothetical protein
MTKMLNTADATGSVWGRSMDALIDQADNDRGAAMAYPEIRDKREQYRRYRGRG